MSTRRMSTRSKNKLPKKAKSNNTCPDEHWKKLRPYLEMAERDQVQNLAKDLFKELWKTNGDKAATAVTDPLLKKLKNDVKKNQSIAGTWKFDKGNVYSGDGFGQAPIDKGNLYIGDNIEQASIECSPVDIELLELESSKASHTLIYKGETLEWENAQDEFKAQLILKYDARSDTIRGELDVSPSIDIEYDPTSEYDPPPSAYGGTISFIASRASASSDD